MKTMCVGVQLFLLLFAVFLASAGRAGEMEDFHFAEKLRSDSLFAAAGDEFMRFARKYPKSELADDAYFDAGESYMMAGKPAEALSSFGKFIKMYPDDRRVCKVHYYRGKILAALNHAEEAAKEFLSVPETDITSPFVDSSLLEAGKSLIAAADYKEASKVLRRLVYERKSSRLTPNALYAYATALFGLKRDLMAKDVLNKLISRYPKAPISAFAALRLADYAVGAQRYDEAVGYLESILERFNEKALRKKALVKLIEIDRVRKDRRSLIDDVDALAAEFPHDASTLELVPEAADAAWNLEDYHKVVALAKPALAMGKSPPDSTGRLSYILAESYHNLGRSDEALEELARFERMYSDSPFMIDALALHAEIMSERSKPLEAARSYNLALLCGASGEKKVSILERLAAISSDELGDTLFAIRYLDEVYRLDRNGAHAERALWRSSLLRERSGFVDQAVRGYESLITLFPDGEFATKAAARIKRLGLRPLPGWERTRDVARIVSSTQADVNGYLKIGEALLVESNDSEGAAPYLEKAYRLMTADTLKAKAGYLFARAKYNLSILHRSDEKRAKGERKTALSVWRDVARRYVGSRWGELSHRSYIDAVAAELSCEKLLSRYDEYLRIYRSGRGIWWALQRKLDLFYNLALSKEGAYADSALALCMGVIDETNGVNAVSRGSKGRMRRSSVRSGAREGSKSSTGDYRLRFAGVDLSGCALGGISSGSISVSPLELRKEAILKSAYLKRLKGDHKGAVYSFEIFTGEFPSESRNMLVFYDLAEELLKLKEYTKAISAYRECIARGPRRALLEKSYIRIGDCFYYQSLFDKAVAAYEDFLSRFPSSRLADEVRYRLAMAMDAGGDRDGAFIGFKELNDREGLSPELKVRVLKRITEHLIAKGEYGNALAFARDLIARKKDADTYTLNAEILLETAEYEEALKGFDRAIKMSGTDSCRVMAGKVRALLGLKKSSSASDQLALFLEHCSRSGYAPSLLLDKGVAEVNDGFMDSAVKTLSSLGKLFPESKEAVDARYYLALCDMKRGGYKDAVKKLQSFIKDAPYSPLVSKAYFKIASAQYIQRNLNLAAHYYSLAAESAPDGDSEFAALDNLGKVYQELEDWEKAAGVWKKMAEKYPADKNIVETLFNLGFCYGRMGRYDLAYEVYNRIPDVTSSEEQQGRAHYWSGVSLKNMKRYKDAVMEFLRVPYLKTGGMWGVTSKLEAASCYEKMGSYGEAEKLCNEVISKYGKGSNWGRLAAKALERIAAEKAGGSGGKDERKSNRDRKGK